VSVDVAILEELQGDVLTAGLGPLARFPDARWFSGLQPVELVMNGVLRCDG
jgi:hypothetical protein